MAWEKVRREDYFQGSNKPFISVSDGHFGFNTLFVRMNSLGPDKRVSIYADPENLKLAFEFHDDERLDSFALARMSSAKKGQKRTALQCASRGIVVKYPWVKAVTKMPVRLRRFEPKKEENLWVIQLCPAFEEKRAKESEEIPSDAQGIYRYLREDGEIVYIGRGNIKNRLKSPGRESWDFDKVEFSIVEDPDQQIKWEDFWIERYKEENNGKLPFYNKVSGISSQNQSDD